MPQLEQVTVPVEFKQGQQDVPAVVHEYCPGLAVTMSNFGTFTVTHVPTGKSMCGHYERYAEAVLMMTKFQLIAKENSFSWVDWSQEQLAGIADNSVPFDSATVTSSDGTRLMTINEWLRYTRMPSFDEFPWEERHPLDSAEENLARLAP